MEQATEKQIAFAKKLGIEDPEKYDKQALRGLIDVKIGEQDKPQKTQQSLPAGKIGVTQGLSEIIHLFQNAYEFGKAGNRHTIRYWDIQELRDKIELLKVAGLIEDDIEIQKV